MTIGILTFVTFAAIALLMYLRLLPALAALPLMALLIAVEARVPAADIVTAVFADGALMLHAAYTTAILGAILAELIHRTRIAEALVKQAAELGGDRPLTLALILTAVVAILFTTLGGLGAVIMVATIVFPILLTLGLPPLTVGCLFLLGMNLGGAFNLTNWQLYHQVLGLSNATIVTFAIPLAALLVIAIAVFALLETRPSRRVRYCAAGPEEKAEHPPIRWYALLSPIVPLAPVVYFAAKAALSELLFGAPPSERFDFPIITALLIGIVYCLATTWRPGQSSMQLLSRAAFTGVGNVAPAVVLMLGIGMLVKAVTHDRAAAAISPLIERILPSSPVGYVVIFALCAPLALYRGPLNLWGMGLGVAVMLRDSGAFSAAAVMAALFSVGQLQGICDPTNTHNVWIANYVGVDVQQVLRRTLPYAWGVAAGGLIIGAVLFLR